MSIYYGKLFQYIDTLKTWDTFFPLGDKLAQLKAELTTFELLLQENKGIV